MMIEQKSEPQTTQTEIQAISQDPSDKTVKGNFKQILQSGFHIIKNVLVKFYSNKKIFIPIFAAFALILLTIIAGTIFGSKTNKPSNIEIGPTKSPYATPISQNQATGSASVFENRLKDIGSDIERLDVKQSKIKPPIIDFDIKF